MGAGGRPIDDEFHLLFECEATSALRASSPGVTGGAWSVRGLLDRVARGPELARFLAGCMDLVDATL